ncbi:tail fiber protein [Zobellia laminariae]|uniref:tail fiber protein n=1 Tax=Zobellia laminariae TaxID=248906 RepID=UPI0012D98ED3|nr:hypothetical protein [Zobellia laminariae]
MKILTRVLFLLICFVSYGQEGNLLNTNTWVKGPAESIYGFNKNGSAEENIIETGMNPFQEESLIWRVKPDPTDTAPTYRGFFTNAFTDAIIDKTADYRFSIWVKIENDEEGRLISMLRGTGSPVYQFSEFDTSSAATARDAHFRSGGNIPVSNEWLLMVGYVSGVNGTKLYTDSGFHNLLGNVVGPLGSAQKRFNNSMDTNFTIINDFNNRTNAGYNVVGNNQNLLFFDPRFEKVVGSPSIEDLLNNTPVVPEGEGGLWSSEGTNINYINGNVGIGVTNPDAPLTVKGKIHTNEVLVDVSAPIVPDYVFLEDYKLKSLAEVQLFIDENGHLPNIKSAEEFTKEGMELKQMNMKLLEKIEELTLYILQQEKRIQILEKSNN